MKRSTVIYRRGKATRSPYAAKEKSKRAYRYPPWITDPRNPEHPMPLALIQELRANLLRVFPKPAAVPLDKWLPHSLWLYRGAAA